MRHRTKVGTVPHFTNAFAEEHILVRREVGMRRKTVIFLLLLAFTFGLATAQDDVNRGEGLIVTLDMSVHTFNHVVRTFEASEFRPRTGQNHTLTHWLISNWEFAKDANAAIQYSTDYFGGRFAFQPQIVGGQWTFGALIRGWAQFSFLRVTLGNDIESTFARTQGSDDGFRVPLENRQANPDNITDSNGLLLEAFLGPFTFAAAAGDFSTSWDPTARISGAAGEDLNKYLDRFDVSYRFGGRIGYEYGDNLRANLSYQISHKTIGNNFSLMGGDSLELQPSRPEAKSYEHLFGLFGSYQFSSIGLTLGYIGSMTSYLDTYFAVIAGEKTTLYTGVPVVLRNGAALHARWDVNDRLALRSENSFVFWTDKNYDDFKTSKQAWNMNLQRREVADRYSDISHLQLRNGIGMDYYITSQLRSSIFLNNSMERDFVKGRTPSNQIEEFSFVRNATHLKLGLTYIFNSNMSVFANLQFDNSLTSRSKDLNAQTVAFFVPTVGNVPVIPVSTIDNEFIFSVPIGITLRMR